MPPTAQYYQKLSFHDACKLRQYRIDQYGWRQKYKLKHNHRLKRTNWRLTASTSYDIYGRSFARRSVVQPGVPAFVNNAGRVMVDRLGADNSTSQYKTHTNVYSGEFWDRNAYLKPQARLPDEIPVENTNHMGDYLAQMFRMYRTNHGASKHYMPKHLSHLVVIDQLHIQVKAEGCKNRKWYSLELVYFREHLQYGVGHAECIEQLGCFDPVPNRWGQKVCGINFDRCKYWIACGVRMDPQIQILFGLAGLTPLSPDTIIRCERLRERKKIEQMADKYVHENLIEKEDENTSDEIEASLD